MARILLVTASILLAGCASTAPEKQQGPVVDAGGYKLDVSEFVGWNITADKDAGLVVLTVEDRQLGGVTRTADFRVLKVTLPANQRNESPDAIAKLLCDGENSFVQRNMFPVRVTRQWRRVNDVRVSDRVAIVYFGSNDISGANRSIVTRSGGPIQTARAYVWIPDRFPKDGSFFVVTGFETVVTLLEDRSESPKARVLLAAITPN